MNITIKKLSWATLATAVPAVFLLVAIFLQIFPSLRGVASVQGASQTIFGGPGASKVVEADTLLTAKDSVAFQAFEATEPEDTTLRASLAALALETTSFGSFVTRDGLTVYRATRGETLSKVATSFGVSLNTLLWANPALRGKALKAGDEIIILPVSGVLHRALEGETLEVVASLYGIPKEEVLAANIRLNEGPLTAGEMVVVPGGKPRRVLAANETALPLIPGYFSIPVAGWNWGELHTKNAVDISNACGTPVIASAEGLVVKTGNADNWNNGYGGFIEIEHPNGTGSRYAHLSKIDVPVGTYVSRREKIGEVGNTGNVTGATGCHLHFEIHGARNPFAK